VTVIERKRFPFNREDRRLFDDYYQMVSGKYSFGQGEHETAKRVLDVMKALPRHRFMDIREEDAWKLYCMDDPESIGEKQTITAESLILAMTTFLRPDLKEKTGRVLEYGTGSGRQAATLSNFFGEVHTLECIRPLHTRTTERLAEMGIKNVCTHYGCKPSEELGDFERILITVACDYNQIPAIGANLGEGGLIVAPTKLTRQQLQAQNPNLKLPPHQPEFTILLGVTKTGGRLTGANLQPDEERPFVRFVPFMQQTSEGTGQRPIPLRVDKIMGQVPDWIEFERKKFGRRKVPPDEQIIDSQQLLESLANDDYLPTLTAATRILDQFTLGRTPLLRKLQPTMPSKYLITPSTE